LALHCEYLRKEVRALGNQVSKIFQREREGIEREKREREKREEREREERRQKREGERERGEGEKRGERSGEERRGEGLEEVNQSWRFGAYEERLGPLGRAI